MAPLASSSGVLADLGQTVGVSSTARSSALRSFHRCHSKLQVPEQWSLRHPRGKFKQIPHYGTNLFEAEVAQEIDREMT